jgi:hypothetical protein
MSLITAILLMFSGSASKHKVEVIEMPPMYIIAYQDNEAAKEIADDLIKIYKQYGTLEY